MITMQKKVYVYFTDCLLQSYWGYREKQVQIHKHNVKKVPIWQILLSIALSNHAQHPDIIYLIIIVMDYIPIRKMCKCFKLYKMDRFKQYLASIRNWI